MSFSLSPLFNGWQGFGTTGLPLNAGLLYTYSAGTSTPLATYTTSAGNIANANPIVLGADGRPPQEIWLTDGLSYKFVLTDSLSNLIATYDNIQSIGGIVNSAISTSGGITQAQADGRYPIYVGVAGGTADVLTASLSTSISALYNGLMIEVDASFANATTTPSFNLTLGTTITGPFTIVKWNLQALSPGDIPGAGNRMILAWASATSNWLLLNPISGTASPKFPVVTAVQAANAITISATSQFLDFRSTTLTSGSISTIFCSPSNLVIPNGATLGFTSTVANRIIVAEINNAGTAELAVINASGGTDLSETGLISTTAISASSTSATTWYSTSARTNVAYRIISAITAVNTAGAWGNPTLVQSSGGQAALLNVTPLTWLPFFSATWKSVAGSSSGSGSSGVARTFGATLTNGYAYPIDIGIISSSSPGAFNITVSGIIIQQISTSSGISPYSLYCRIPAGATYSVNVTSGGNPSTWLELS